ncbi:MAG: DUF6056 family protein, partial [Candidatus Woesebacteria bacterium]|nr:DUF6056 family protein [Candidatus Woesebacteria bacterium]
IFSIVPFNRMAGDDYSSAIMARLGLWGSIVATYKTSMGRFSAVLIETPFSSTLANNGKIIVYSLITFGLLIISFSILVKRITGLKINNIYIYIISIALVACLYQLTPNKSESWYWLTGSVVYLWPIILFSLASSYLFVKLSSKIDYLIPIVITFLSTSFNEAFGLIVIVFLSGAFILLRKNKEKRNLIVSMLIASLLSFLIMYLAPGNDARKSSYGSNPMSLPGSILYSISEGPKLYYSLVINNAMILIPLVILLLSVFVFINTKKKNNEFDLDNLLFKLFITIFSGVVLSVVFMLPSFVGLGRVQPDRSEISLAFIIIVQMLSIAYLLADIVLIKVKSTNYFYVTIVSISAIILIFSSSVFTVSLPQDLYIAKEYSIAYDTMISRFKEISLTNNQKTEVEVSLPDHGLVAILLDPVGVYSYKNQSLSLYYKIGKVNTIKYEK